MSSRGAAILPAGVQRSDVEGGDVPLESPWESVPIRSSSPQAVFAVHTQGASSCRTGSGELAALDIFPAFCGAPAPSKQPGINKDPTSPAAALLPPAAAAASAPPPAWC